MNNLYQPTQMMNQAFDLQIVVHAQRSEIVEEEGSSSGGQMAAIFSAVSGHSPIGSAPNFKLLFSPG